MEGKVWFKGGMLVVVEDEWVGKRSREGELEVFEVKMYMVEKKKD